MYTFPSLCSIQAKAKYLEVGMRMRDYEVEKYDRWREDTEQKLPLLMKRTLLVVVTSSGVITASQTQNDLVCTPPSELPLISQCQVKRERNHCTLFSKCVHLFYPPPVCFSISYDKITAAYCFSTMYQPPHASSKNMNNNYFSYL